MKKVKTVEIDCCDLCGLEYAYIKCGACQKCVCNEHAKTQMVTFHQNVYYDSSDDLRLCHDCYVNNKYENRELLDALKDVAVLREQYEEWMTFFTKVREEKEKEVERLSRKYGH